MTRTSLSSLLLPALLALACSSGPVSVGDDRRGTSGGDSAAGAGGGGGDATAGGDAGASNGQPTAEALLGLLEPCLQISNGLLAREAGKAKDVPVCGFGSAVYWTSQLSVDCDGKRTDTCNAQTDPQSSDSTLGKDSQGQSLDAALVPFVEVPRASAAFDYEAAGLSMGSVVAVIYQRRLAYGVLGQVQAQDVIGAASVAMAEAVGIDSDPIRGGLQTKDVTYLAFKGPEWVAPALEDVARSAVLAERAASELLAAGR
jgi:hypothetical protein